MLDISFPAEDTLRQANAALYEAKAAGRNCVAFSDAGDLKLLPDGSVRLDATSVLSIFAAKRR